MNAIKRHAMRILLRYLPTCEHVSEMQSRALDTRLSLGELIGLKVHLMICLFCVRYGRQIVLIRTALRKEGRSPDACLLPHRKLGDAARARIEAAIRNESQAN